MVLQASPMSSGERSPGKMLEVCLALRQEGKERREIPSEVLTSQWQEEWFRELRQSIAS